LFPVVDDAITTDGVRATEVLAPDNEASGSAGVGGEGVVQSVVALLVSVSSAISAFPLSSGRAPVVVDQVAIIALLSGIDDTISKARKNARSSAWSSGNVAILGTEVAFFVEILDAIAAIGQETVGSASVGESVVVEASSIALLIGSFGDAVSTFDLAISAAWNSSVSILDAIHGTHVTLLVQTSVENAITTFGEGAVSSACTIGVGVLGSVVALLDGSGWEKTISTAGLAVRKTGSSGSVSGAKVAEFVPSQVNNTITALGKGTVGSASIGSESVGGSVIALFSAIDDTISAFGGGARRPAGVGYSVRVSSAVVTGLG